MSNSGIYKILHEPTTNFYVGSTVNFNNRKASHWCEMRNGKKKGLWATLLNPFDSDEFIFTMLEEVLPDPKLLIDAENKWLKELKPTLNLSLEATFRPYQYGSKNPNSKHDEQRQLLLLKTIAESPWKSLAAIDRDLGFTRGTAWKVRTGTRYAHLKLLEPELYDFVISGRYQTLYLLDPQNIMWEFTGSITSISRQIGIHDSHLFDLFYGKINHAKGWKLIYD